MSKKIVINVAKLAPRIIITATIVCILRFASFVQGLDFKDNVRFGHSDAVRMNILLGVDLDEYLDGRPAILHACNMNHWDIVDILINAGANVNLPDEKGKTALMYAAAQAKKQTIRLLLRHNAMVNLADDQGNTPLIFAAESEDADIVALLLSHGADVTLHNKLGTDALMVAKSFHTPKTRLVSLLEHATAQRLGKPR